MDQDDGLDVPRRTNADVYHGLVKAGISAIPGIGSPAAEIFGLILAPPISRRTEQWMETMAQRLLLLEEKVEGLTLESLSSNEPFVTTLLTASQVALRTHDEGKLEALRNIVLNTAICALDDDLQLRFLILVEALSPWQIRILTLFRDPVRWFDEHQVQPLSMLSGGGSTVLEHALPELKGRRAFYDPLVRDLHNHGLMPDNLHVTMTAGGAMSPRITGLASKFLAFLESPLGGDRSD